MLPSYQHNITWTNVDPIYWRIYASPGLEKLMTPCVDSSGSAVSHIVTLFQHDHDHGQNRSVIDDQTGVVSHDRTLKQN